MELMHSVTFFLLHARLSFTGSTDRCTHRIEKEQKGNSVLRCVPVKFGYSRSAMFRGMNSATRVLSEQLRSKNDFSILCSDT